MTDREIADRLRGAWNLLDWRSVDARGERFPFGEDALGSLLYSVAKNGERVMLAQLSRRHRPSIDGASDAAARTQAKLAAFDSYVAYGGSWRVESGRVIHRVTSSLFANWIGTDLVRSVEFSDEQLILRTLSETLRDAVHRLIWTRL